MSDQVWLVCESTNGEPVHVFETRELAEEWVDCEQARLIAVAPYWATSAPYWIEPMDLLDRLPVE